MEPFWGLVGFQEEKLPDRRLRADCDLESKLVGLLSEDREGWWWLLAGLPRVWAEVASRSRPRRLDEAAEEEEVEAEEVTAAAAALTGRGFLQSSPSSEPEDRLCIPTTVDGACAVSGRVCRGCWWEGEGWWASTGGGCACVR